MKTNYISAFSLAILLFFSFQLLKAQSWEEISLPQINGEEAATIRIESFGDAVYFCTNKGLFKSLDNGSTFNNLTWVSGVTQNLPIKSIFIDEDNGNMYIGSEDSVFKSTDNGNSWAATILSNISVVNIAKSGSNLLVAYADGNLSGGVYYSSDGLVSVQQSSIVDLPMRDFEIYNNTVYLAGKEAVYQSTDNGETFIVSGTGHSTGAYYFSMLKEGTTLFAGDAWGNGLFKSVDNGQTWVNTDPNTYFGFCQVFDITSANGTILAVVDGAQCVNNIALKMSQDNGVTWTSGLFNMPNAFFNELGKNASGSCFFVYGPSIHKLFRTCNLTIGIPKNDLSGISLTPNPTTGIVNLSGNTGTEQISIYSTRGKLLKTIPQLSYRNQLDFSEFSTGLYFVKVSGENGEKIFKVLKQ